MKIILPDFKKSPTDFMRSLGYAFDRAEGAEQSFMRRLAGHDYPRCHVYVRTEGSNFIVNLHIDQKKPSYGNHTAHSGEYDGPLVEQEADRIRRAAE